MTREAKTRSDLGGRVRAASQDAASEVSPIRARLLGQADLWVGDRLLTGRDWPRRQARSILLQLLSTPGHRLPRDVVLDAHWPDQDLPTSLNALYKSLHALRRALDPGLQRGRESAYIDVANDHIALVPHGGLWIDVDRFDRLIREAERLDDPRDTLRAALVLVRGEFVADEPYADWPVSRRESLRALRVRATLKLAELDLVAGDPMATIGLLESLLVGEPALEEAHRAIVRALMASGQRGLALQQIERCRLVLQHEFDTTPDDETRHLERLLRATTSSVGADVVGHVEIAQFGVPGVPTATVGRSEDIAAVQALLSQAGTRLVTIVGPGGVGKTRLATELARAAASRYPDGTGFVDVSGLRDERLVLPAIMHVLAIPVRLGHPPIDALRDWLARRPRFLLVVDNLEHLAGIDQPLAALLNAIPDLTVLATSREPVHIRAEWVYRLEPLALPDADQVAPVVREVASVALFLQQARAWGGRGEADGDIQLASVAALCHQLEGLPLAIELAAARTWEIPPLAMLEAIGDRFATLRNGPRDLPVRHQALDATIGWSYDLLPEGEQRLFRGVAVFAGGIDLEAMCALFGDDASALAENLADKSLLQWEQREGRRRAIVLESVREFAELKLAASGDLTDLRLAHAAYFAGILPPSGSDASDDGQVSLVRRTERDHDNFHLALAVALEHGRSDLALRLISGLGVYWFTHGTTGDVGKWIDAALAMDPDRPSEDRAWTALWGSMFCWRMADAEGGIRFEQQARATWGAMGSAHGVARVDHAIAIRMGMEGRLVEAWQSHLATLEIFRAVDDCEGIVFGQAGLAHVLGLTGDPVGAVRLLEAALSTALECGDLALQSYVQARLPVALVAVGDDERAVAHAREGERVATLIGDQRSLPWVSILSAMLADDLGDHAAAMDHAQAALRGFRDSGDGLNEWLGAWLCADAALHLGQVDVARDHALQAIGAARVPVDTPVLLLNLAGLLVGLGRPADALRTQVSGLRVSERMGMVIAGRLGEQQGMILEAGQALLSRDEAVAARRLGELLEPDAALEAVHDCLLAMSPS